MMNRWWHTPELLAVERKDSAIVNMYSALRAYQTTSCHRWQARTTTAKIQLPMRMIAVKVRDSNDLLSYRVERTNLLSVDVASSRKIRPLNGYISWFWHYPVATFWFVLAWVLTPEFDIVEVSFYRPDHCRHYLSTVEAARSLVHAFRSRLQ